MSLIKYFIRHANLYTLAYLDIVTEVVCHDPTQYVERDVSSCVSHMRVIIDGRSASVPGHFMWVDRDKKFLLPRESV